MSKVMVCDQPKPDEVHNVNSGLAGIIDRTIQVDCPVYPL